MRTAKAILCLLSSLMFVSSARAAVISITSVDGADISYDLTNTYGIADWAYWAQTASPITTPTPSNEKSGASLIGAISNFGGSSVRGSTSTTRPPYDFAFSDGTSTASGTVSNLIGLFNSALGASGNGLGVQVNVTAPTADPFTIYVWGTTFEAKASLTATAGVDSGSDSTLDQRGTGLRSPGKLFTINVTPDSAGQTVNVKLVQTDSNDGNSNASISAVAVVVPEPSTLTLLGIAAASLTRRRRRRA